MEQPVPRVSQSDVERVLERDFAPAERERLSVLLADPDLDLTPRVVLAVLKLSGSNVTTVAANIEAAQRDWRDVVAYAEYPAYMKATSASTELDGARREALIEADWTQYQAWLYG